MGYYNTMILGRYHAIFMAISDNCGRYPAMLGQLLVMPSQLHVGQGQIQAVPGQLCDKRLVNWQYILYSPGALHWEMGIEKKVDAGLLPDSASLFQQMWYLMEAPY